MQVDVVKIGLFWIVIWAITGCGYEGISLQKKQKSQPDNTHGYLSKSQLPDSFALIPTVPKRDTPTMKRDRAVSIKSMKLRGSKRWELATRDATLDFPEAADTFTCALGAPITKEDTPNTYNLLQKLYTDAKASTHPAKDIYHRKRPFMVNGKPTCTPKWEPKMRKSGSYPSGHSAIGWATALTLAEIDPNNSTQILARGRAYSESRVVCNAHWYSDIMWGRFMGASTVSRLHDDAEYRKAVKAAKVEIKRAKQKGLKPTSDCRFEAEALSVQLGL